MTQAVALAQQASTGVSQGFKNRIINGAMVIDQRNAGASVTITNTSDVTYTLDRWFGYASSASKFSMQQNAGSVTAPAGFTNYLGVTSLAATTVNSGDYYFIGQYIEGFNTADLNWGTANAKTVTMSFWVRSSLTGTFGGSLNNTSITRSFPFSYTINSANTWEYKTVTVTGDTSGTWVGATNGIGIRIFFSVGMGSSNSTTAGAWASGDYRSSTGSVNVVSTNGATLYLTGIQLEVGSSATSFEYRSYGTELGLCQRYYWKNTGYVYTMHGSGTVLDATRGDIYVKYPVSMRTSPTMSVSSSPTTGLQVGPNVFAVTSISGVGGTGLDTAFVRCTTAGTLTAGTACIFRNDNNATGFFELSAEL